jgi:hypothetical protein
MRKLLAVLATAIGTSVGVVASPANAAPSVSPVEVVAPAPEHNPYGCTSYKFSSSQARGYCQHLHGGDFIREWATCQNYVTGSNLVTRTGAAVYAAWVESKATCPSGYVVVSHRLAVFV